MAATATAAHAGTWFAWLDPLRGFAALTVLGYHLIVLGGFAVPNVYPLTWLHFGWLGVDLFYAISGAVIVLTLARLQQQRGDRWRVAFAMRRLARVVPLYLLTGAVFVALVQPQLLERPDAWRVILAHLLFVQNWFPSTHGAINGPSWTLAVEMQFYAGALLAGGLCLRTRPWRLAMLLAAVALAWRGGVWWYQGFVMADPDARTHFVYATQLPGVIDVFAAGILAARLHLGGQLRTSPAVLGMLALMAWLGVLAFLHAFAVEFWSSPVSAIGFRSAVAVAAGLSVAAALAAGERRSPRWMRWSGDLSYGLYLWHMPVLLWLLAHAGLAPAPRAAAVFAITAVLAAVAYVAVEHPFQRLARRSRRHA